MSPAIKAEGEDRLLEKRGRTMLAKIWDQHVIARIGDDTDLLHVDRHLLHDLGGSRGLLDLFAADFLDPSSTGCGREQHWRQRSGCFAGNSTFCGGARPKSRASVPLIV